MDTHQIVWNEKVAKDIIAHLENRRMEGSYAATADHVSSQFILPIRSWSKFPVKEVGLGRI